MSTTPNFASILDETATEVRFPPPLPVGTYLCTVGQFEDTKKPSKAGNMGVVFPLKPIDAMQDVDAEALQEVGGCEGKNLNITFWITPDSIGFLDEFHQNCGCDMSDGTSRRGRNQEVLNAQILAVVEHEIDNNTGRSWPRVRRTAKAD